MPWQGRPASRAAGASVRRHLEEFEASLGVPLLERTRHGVRTTAAGEWLAVQGRALLTSANVLFDSVRHLEEVPTGTLTLAIMPGLASDPLAAACQMLVRRFPRLDFCFSVRPDLMKALQAGEAEIAIGFLPDDLPLSYESLRIGEADIRLLASEAYLRAHGPIESPDDLSRHPLLRWATDVCNPVLLPLRDGRYVKSQPRVVSNDVMMLRAAAELGAGLVYAPDSLARQFMTGRSLVRVLDGQVGHQLGVGLVVPKVISAVPRIRAVWEIAVAIMEKRLVVSPSQAPEQRRGSATRS